MQSAQVTGGEHQFIVAAHIDKKHIHNHIEFNSTALDCSHKFNNIKNSFIIPLRKANEFCFMVDIDTWKDYNVQVQ